MDAFVCKLVILGLACSASRKISKERTFVAEILLKKGSYSEGVFSPILKD
jgi:hypothetical protein